MAELRVHKNGIVCMDGNHVVAKARPLGGAYRGYWQLKMYGGSWLASKDATPSKHSLQVIKSKPAAMKEMRSLCHP